MPMVRIYLTSEMFEDDKLLAAIRPIVAEALICPDFDGVIADLDPDADIEVFLHEIEPEDHANADIMLDIEAIAYPERVANRNQRAETIRSRIQSLLEPVETVAVWLKTVDASWAGPPV